MTPTSTTNDSDFDLWLEAGRTEKHYWRDLWRFRELFYVLAWRDVSVRYKQTVIGVAWALIRPLVTMLVMTVIFSRIAKLPSEGTTPYALMVFAAMLPWQFFAAGLASASDSIVSNSNLISKVYFPRLIIPVAAVVTAFIDFLLSFFIMLAMMAFYQFWPGLRILALPAFVLLAILTAVGPGLLLTALSVRYRDFKQVLPFIVQFGLYVSPVGFSTSLVPEQWRLLYSLNPMVGVIDGFRWCLLGGDTPLYLPGFAISTSVTLLLCLGGVRYFRKTERSFADVI